MEISKTKNTIHGRKYMCGVPGHACTGNLTQMHDHGRKLHTTSLEAFKCLQNYMMLQGYTIGSNHTMEPPVGSNLPIVMLPKQSKMADCRPGKARWMFHYNADIVPTGQPRPSIAK